MRNKNIGTLVITILALILALFIVIFFASESQAQVEGRGIAPTLQIGCGVVKTAAIDPIVRPAKGEAHQHVFFGNRSVNANSTHKSLVNNRNTTCNKSFDTSSYWHPILRDGNGNIAATKTVAYYTGSGDQSEIKSIPEGLKLIGREVDYRCGLGKTTTKPPYGCKNKLFRVRVHFPNCWDTKSLEPESMTTSRGMNCPSTHPYRIPSIRIGTHLNNTNGIKAPLEIAHGGGMWMDYTYMHGDVFNAGQNPAFDNAIKRCVINRADGKPDSFCN
jgi:hypothetical protein